MTKLEQIEKTVEELSSKDFEAFAEWFEALQQQRWDTQIEADVSAGRLDRFADQALHHRRGDLHDGVRHCRQSWEIFFRHADKLVFLLVADDLDPMILE